MKNNIKRIVSIILLPIMFVSILKLNVLAEFNRNYTLTGNGITDICNIALAQYQKRGAELGYNVDWCAYFVSDCAKLAGLEKIIPSHANVSGLSQNIINAGGSVVNTPKVGDLAIIDWEGWGRNSHVEIVYQVSGNTVYTIGGNSGPGAEEKPCTETQVWKHNFVQTSSNITRFVRPAYSLSESSNQCKISFDLRGGSIASAIESRDVTAFNTDRGTNQLIVYTNSGGASGTNGYGVEVAVDANGRVTQRRDYGSSTQLTIPKGGFVLSGQGSSGDFVNRIQVGQYVGYSTTNNKTIASYYTNKNEYLFNHKKVKTGDQIGELPIPARDGYSFLGWYTTKDTGNVYPIDYTYIVENDVTLYAHWTRVGQAGNRINFEVQGGSIPQPHNQIQVTKIDSDRGENDVVVYTEGDSIVSTNKYGMEIAVDINGKIVARRDWGEEKHLTVPTNGFVLSLISSKSDFYDPTELGDYIGYITEEDGNTYAYHYKNQGEYLFYHKYVKDGNLYGGLPIPAKEGFLFDGWFDENGTEIKWDSIYSSSNLYAYWVNKDEAKASNELIDVENKKAYQRYDYIMTWEEAKKYCETLGGHLVTITSQNEQDFILNSNFFDSPRRGLYYIGATDKETEGTWKWVTGENVAYQTWDQSLPEPSGGTNENYAAIMGVDYTPNSKHNHVIGEWIDVAEYDYGNAVYATSNTGFICEFDSIEAEHDYGSGEVLKEATCKEEGQIQYTCAVCKESYVETIPKTDHTYSLEWTIDIEPTTTSEGSKSRHCANCDAKIDITVIPKLEEVVVGGILSLTNTAGRVGDIVDVYINLQENPGIVGVTLMIEYDSEKLELVSCQDLGVLNDYQFSDISRVPFILNWEDALAEVNNVSNGDIAKLQFKILKDLGEDGEVVKLSVDTVYDVNINDVDFSAVDGKINMKSYTSGDVNDDGTINSKDSILLRKYILGSNASINLDAADVNRDGIINSKDSIILRKYILGGNVELK